MKERNATVLIFGSIKGWRWGMQTRQGKFWGSKQNTGVRQDSEMQLARYAASRWCKTRLCRCWGSRFTPLAKGTTEDFYEGTCDLRGKLRFREMSLSAWQIQRGWHQLEDVGSDLTRLGVICVGMKIPSLRGYKWWPTGFMIRGMESLMISLMRPVLWTEVLLFKHQADSCCGGQ